MTLTALTRRSEAAAATGTAELYRAPRPWRHADRPRQSRRHPDRIAEALHP